MSGLFANFASEFEQLSQLLVDPEEVRLEGHSGGN